MSIFLILFLYAVWTSSFALGKIILAVSFPVFVTAIRMLFAGVLLLVYLLIWKREQLKLNKFQFFSVILLAIFSIYLCNVLEFWGLQYLSAAKACFLYSLSPFFAAFFSFLHFKEKMTKKKWIGLLIGSIGFVPVLLQSSQKESLAGILGGFLSWPTLALIGAALCAVYGQILLRLLVKDKKSVTSLSPLTANGYSMLIGGAFALVHSFIVDPFSPLPILAGGAKTFTQGILIMTFLSNILCYNLYGFLLKRFTATFLSFMGLLSPFFASLSGWILLGEVPSFTIFCSTAIVSLGLWIVYSEELKQGYIQKKQALQEQKSGS